MNKVVIMCVIKPLLVPFYSIRYLIFTCRTMMKQFFPSNNHRHQKATSASRVPTTKPTEWPLVIYRLADHSDRAIS